jgi:hypothetical protein
MTLEEKACFIFLGYFCEIDFSRIISPCLKQPEPVIRNDRYHQSFGIDEINRERSSPIFGCDPPGSFLGTIPKDC